MMNARKQSLLARLVEAGAAPWMGYSVTLIVRSARGGLRFNCTRIDVRTPGSGLT